MNLRKDHSHNPNKLNTDLFGASASVSGIEKLMPKESTSNLKNSTVDVLAPIPMKSVAKCDKHCELHNASQLILERIWHWLVYQFQYACFSVSLINALHLNASETSLS